MNLAATCFRMIKHPLKCLQSKENVIKWIIRENMLCITKKGEIW